MTERWHQFFESAGAHDSGWLASAVNHWMFSERLRGHLLELTPAGGRILEVGCGPGYTGMLLSAIGYSFTGIDNEPRLIDRAIALANQLGVEARFVNADAMDLSQFHGQFELAFSAGVLEHFERSQTVALLREQARCAKVVVIAIPTPWTRYTGQVTDERFYSVSQLRQMVREAGMTPVRSFGFGDITATKGHRAVFRVLPRAVLRVAQNLGYAYGIAVAGQSATFVTGPH